MALYTALTLGLASANQDFWRQAPYDVTMQKE